MLTLNIKPFIFKEFGCIILQNVDTLFTFIFQYADTCLGITSIRMQKNVDKRKIKMF